MTVEQIQKRNERAQQLRVLQVNEETFFVESGEGKIAYKVLLSPHEVSCTCGDFARNGKTDVDFRCKHIMAILNSEPNQMFETKFLEKKRIKLDERFIIIIDGREFVKYQGLLDLGHQKGLLKILVDIIQIPTKENGNFAICKAEVESKTGETYTDIGDANPNNCHSKAVKHLLRIASTRAIARALRSFTNIGLTCLEELGDLKDIIGNESSKPRPVQRRKPAGKSDNTADKGKQKAEVPNQPEQKEPPAKPPVQKQEKPAKNQKQSKPVQNNTPQMSEAQKRAILNLSRRRGISVEELESMAVETYGVSLEALSSEDASAFIRTLQQAA